MAKREDIGKPEDIAVVGPRGSGKTTIAVLYAEHHTANFKKVLLITKSGPRRSPMRMSLDKTDPLTLRPLAYVMVHPDAYREREREWGRGDFDVVIHDGYIPDRPCRVIATSEIF